MFKWVYSGRSESSAWEHVVFRHPWNCPNFLDDLVWPTKCTMPSFFFVFWWILRFLEFSRPKKVNKWSHVSRLAYNVRNNSNLTWMSTMGMLTYLKKLWLFQECPKLDHVQWRVFGCQKALFESTLFSSHPWNGPNFFMALYDQFKTPCQVVWIFNKFCIFWSFSDEKRPINDRACRKLHAVSEIIQTYHWCLPWAMPTFLQKLGSFQEYPKLNHVQWRVFGC